ncbi:hypothetical protein GJ744_003630 [Endocarpon pusillum]|uniref:Uncharacterized protein n=1 Tax=Endocarpon pusillum TaxID=364733 RepID=A0A8H7AAE9_9EURO|nr:hypothetical protein GJ744_003630 [Endocarpon pusillum]
MPQSDVHIVVAKCHVVAFSLRGDDLLLPGTETLQLYHRVYAQCLTIISALCPWFKTLDLSITPTLNFTFSFSAPTLFSLAPLVVSPH